MSTIIKPNEFSKYYKKMYIISYRNESRIQGVSKGERLRELKPPQNFRKIKNFYLKSEIFIDKSSEINNVFQYTINFTVMYLRKICFMINNT